MRLVPRFVVSNCSSKTEYLFDALKNACDRLPEIVGTTDEWEIISIPDTRGTCAIVAKGIGQGEGLSAR